MPARGDCWGPRRQEARAETARRSRGPTLPRKFCEGPRTSGPAWKMPHACPRRLLGGPVDKKLVQRRHGGLAGLRSLGSSPKGRVQA
eukprot:15388259-Alexandrium_andersonii.AAC.1